MKARDLDRRFKLTDQQKRELIYLRKEKWTQGQLAEKFGVSQPYVSRLVAQYFSKSDGIGNHSACTPCPDDILNERS